MENHRGGSNWEKKEASGTSERPRKAAELQSEQAQVTQRAQGRGEGEGKRAGSSF